MPVREDDRRDGQIPARRPTDKFAILVVLRDVDLPMRHAPLTQQTLREETVAAPLSRVHREFRRGHLNGQRERMASYS